MSGYEFQQLSTTAFGDLKVESSRPITQISSQYGLLTNVLTVTDSASSGTASITDRKYTIDTGASASGLASILTQRQLAYRAGQGAMIRLTALFSDGVADSLQAAGLITGENSFAFGYIGENFGIIHSYDGMDELQELTLATLAGAGPETATVTVDGTPYNVNLTGAGTIADDAYEIAVSLNSQVPNYSFTSNQDQVVAIAQIPGAAGSFSYSSSGTSTGSWNQITAGMSPTTDFIPQANWNVDTRISSNPDINLNPQLGNVYQIQFQYLGFGAINFSIEDRDSGEFCLVHRIKIANSRTTPSVSQPTFRGGWLVQNSGNTTNVRVQGSSAGLFIEGDVFRDVPPRAGSNDQLAVGATLTNIVALRNRLTFNDMVNRAEVYPLSINASTQANKIAFFSIILNPTFGSNVTWSYVDKDNSIVEESDDAVTVSGGQIIGTITVVSGTSVQVSFNRSFNTETSVYPGTEISIAAVVPSGPAADCQVSVTYQEDM